MLPDEGFAAQPGFEVAPENVNTPLPRATEEKRLDSTNSRRAELETGVPNSPRSATPSLSRASAAIQPLISTIGMPGPGCAAPPAR